MNNRPVIFSRGESANFIDLDKDPDTLYFITDTNEIFLGDSRFAMGSDIDVTVTGEGPLVVDIVWHQDTRLLEIVRGDASAIESSIRDIVESLLVGFKVRDDDLILSQDSEGIKSTLSLTVENEDSDTFIKLVGKEGQTVSVIDVSQFAIAGNLKSASISHKDVSGESIRILTMNFDNPSKDSIELDVDKLIQFGTYEFVETITDQSTHKQIPTAKAVNDKIKDNVHNWETV